MVTTINRSSRIRMDMQIPTYVSDMSLHLSSCIGNPNDFLEFKSRILTNGSMFIPLEMELCDILSSK